MDVAAFIISLLALGVSIIVAFVEAKREYNISKISLEFEFYKEIFENHLIKLIPQARNCLHINRTTMTLSGVDGFISELNQLRKDILYFKYSNPKFYSSLKRSIQDLEDFVIDSSATTFDTETKKDFFQEMQSKIEEIYNTISKAYLGKI